MSDRLEKRSALNFVDKGADGQTVIEAVDVRETGREAPCPLPRDGGWGLDFETRAFRRWTELGAQVGLGERRCLMLGRAASFRMAVFDVVEERIDAVCGNVGMGLEIGRRREAGSG